MFLLPTSMIDLYFNSYFYIKKEMVFWLFSHLFEHLNKSFRFLFCSCYEVIEVLLNHFFVVIVSIIWSRIMQNVHRIGRNINELLKKEPGQSYLDTYLYTTTTEKKPVGEKEPIRIGRGIVDGLFK